jgi:hypothetical protein
VAAFLILCLHMQPLSSRFFDSFHHLLCCQLVTRLGSRNSCRQEHALVLTCFCTRLGVICLKRLGHDCSILELVANHVYPSRERALCAMPDFPACGDSNKVFELSCFDLKSKELYLLQKINFGARPKMTQRRLNDFHCCHYHSYFG